jgi:GNAT superfamily N-acetyltransferase
VLGVDPAYQGQGCASRLLKPRLARLDKEKLPAYLETTIEDYVPMYRHFGFEVIKEEVLPGSGAKMWVMLRGNK